jgi:nucleoside-diphosphate-sugar epimerase
MNTDDGRALPLFIYQTLLGKNITVYGEGTQTRSFCYIDDLVDGIVKLLDCPKAKALPVNLGNPDELKLLELLDKIKSIAGYLPKITYHPLPEDDPQRRQPDITRAKKLLGWQPKISLDEGLKITFDYFKKKLSKSL